MNEELTGESVVQDKHGNCTNVGYDTELECRVDDMFGETIELRGWSRVAKAVILPLTYKVHEDGAMVRPFMALQREKARGLMSSLYRCGIRPNDCVDGVAEARALHGQIVALEQQVCFLKEVITKLMATNDVAVKEMLPNSNTQWLLNKVQDMMHTVPVFIPPEFKPLKPKDYAKGISPL